MAKQLTWISGTDADLNNYKALADDSTIVFGAQALDIGQGNAVVVDTDDDQAAFYFDVGAGCFWNTHTRPDNLEQKFELDDGTVIVLSHWDADHWFAAGNLLLEDAKKCRWLAPRQLVSPMHQKLAAQLKGKLRLWPKNRDRSLSIQTGDGCIQIDKCTGDERNYSGLAMTLVKHDKDGDQIIVLPGDAGFQHIPSLDQDNEDQIEGEVVGMMATHHGSRTHLQDIPKPSQWGGTIIYSYGNGNGYGHPAAEAVEAYEDQGWVKSEPKDLDEWRTPVDPDEDCLIPFFEDDED
jgi:beta-lactamase superfamily II metal-dependent hydrolase